MDSHNQVEAEKKDGQASLDQAAREADVGEVASHNQLEEASDEMADVGAEERH